METASSFASKLGRARMAEALGIGQPAISNAVSRGVFPATWFKALKGLCDAKGENCPDHLFNFLESSAAEEVSCLPDQHGAEPDALQTGRQKPAQAAE